MMNKIAILVMIVQGSVALFLGLALFDLWKSTSMTGGKIGAAFGSLIFPEIGLFRWAFNAFGQESNPVFQGFGAIVAGISALMLLGLPLALGLLVAEAVGDAAVLIPMMFVAYFYRLPFLAVGAGLVFVVAWIVHTLRMPQSQHVPQ